MKYTAFGISKQSNRDFTLHMTVFEDKKDPQFFTKSNLGQQEVKSYWHVATEYALRGNDPLHAFTWDKSPLKLNHVALALSADCRELYLVTIQKKITWENIVTDSRRYTIFDWAHNASRLFFSEKPIYEEA